MIVLVDNNRDNFQFIKDACASIDPALKCLSLVFADEAIGALKTGFIERPDAILFNFNMPGSKGVEFISKLRADSDLEHIPVIFYANKITLEIYRSIENAGCTMIIERPRTFREWKIKMLEVLQSIDGPQMTTVPLMSFPQEAFLTINE